MTLIKFIWDTVDIFKCYSFKIVKVHWEKESIIIISIYNYNYFFLNVWYPIKWWKETCLIFSKEYNICRKIDLLFLKSVFFSLFLYVTFFKKYFFKLCISFSCDIIISEINHRINKTEWAPVAFYHYFSPRV